MVWQKKAAAPAFANMTQAAAAAISGTPDAWIVPWFDLTPISVNLDVNALCAAGPRDPVEFDVTDFLGYIGGNRIGNALSGAQLGAKVEAWMMTKVFQAYCENVTSGGTHLVYIGRFTSGVRAGHGFSNTTDWPIPAGVQGIRLQVVSVVGSNASVHFVGYAGGSNIANPSPGNWDFIGVGVIHESTWTAAIDHVTAYDGVDGDVVDFWWIASGTVVDAVVDAIDQPDSAIPPPVKVYTTIADLGEELDHLENKLHAVLDYTLGKTIDDMGPPLEASELVDVVADDEDIVLAKDVKAFIVTVSNLGNQTDERFGEPRMLHNLGRVVLGNGTLWLPPVEITVTPMLLFKPDNTITVCRVQVYAPSTATVTSLVRSGGSP